ncbi:uncharacterized protein EI90DRAFT_2828434, partial [Cantharellus anzutake]|uniref:uncharacterized protein n=1 Tax=Cantharellus anzutake TaxID=1750568 RepID=UPI00190308C9
FVRLCHGDLGTQERHDATTESHAIESTPQERLQFLVTIPGGFHIRMACVDAIWRVHIQPKALREVRGGIFDQFKILQPKDSSKLASNPTYRMLNDGILHLTSSHLLVCWERATGFSDLKEFADSDPSWSEIVALSKKICQEKIAGWISEVRRQSEDPRDYLEEGNLLFRRDGLWYCMLAHAMNTGAIGAMEDLLWLWVLMFSGCGKHKYAVHLAKFLRNLHSVYPARLAQVIRSHWVCNPSGRPDGFRGVDWLVERNNLYTKAVTHLPQVIIGGSSSNRTLTHIINQSSLIETYRMVHVNIEQNFYIKHRGTQHAPAKMEVMLQMLQERI